MSSNQELSGPDLSQGIALIHIPIYNVGGWYDIFDHGNISNFEYLQNQGAKGARGNQKLMMGPFGHGNLSGNLNYPGFDSLKLSGDQEIRWCPRCGDNSSLEFEGECTR